MTKNTEVNVTRQSANLPMTRQDVLERYVTPAADIVETPGAYVLTIDLPGAGKDTIAVRIEKDTLTISAPVQRHRADNATLLFSELRSTTYYRVFNLGDGVDRNAVHAHYQDGVLSIRLPRTERSKPREIPIQ